MTSDGSVVTLQGRIAEFRAKMAHHAPAEVVSALSAELKKLADSGIANAALQVGGTAPDFTLPDARGGTVTLSTLLARGPVVLTFYRGGWCPYCDLQLRSYQAVLPEIHRLGAELVAVSPETPDYSLSTVEKKGLTFPVLSDAHHAVTRKYGLVYALSDVLKKLQTAFGNPIPKFNGDDSWELPMPGTFVLDRGGVVRLAHINPDYMVRLEPAAILKALEALQA